MSEISHEKIPYLRTDITLSRDASASKNDKDDNIEQYILITR